MEVIIGILVLILRIAPALGSGYLAYEWVDPHTFLGFVGFVFVWGVFGYVADIIMAMILGALGLIAGGGR